jgi:hypothetical protein
MPGSLSSMNRYSGTEKGQSEVLSTHHFLTVLVCNMKMKPLASGLL